MEAGLDLPILNPNNAAMMGAVDAFHVLANIDRGSEKYVAKYADTVAEKIVTVKKDASGKTSEPVTENAEKTIGEFIKKGLGDSAAKLVKAMLENTDPLDIVNNELIPALDVVGAEFEKGKIFLPQLLNSAQAAEAGFNVIKEHLAKNNAATISKGKIVLATVKGDVHDIGKNIVKTVLQNYGYTVIDLGKDVPPEKVVEAVKEHSVKLVGLSALMTTTVSSMEETIKALRAAGLDCKVMVGGAVLTAEFAKQIGADFYAKDAKQSADIAKEVLG
jgi:5-methyltetrahydrofolate--homocysteine methyltransferase